MASPEERKQSPSERFKQCPLCDTWFSLEDIMHNPIVKPIGMLLEDADPELNFFYFNHEIPGCGTTFVIPVDEMTPYTAPSAEFDLLTGVDACRGKCLRRTIDGECRGACYYAPYRRLLRELIANREKALGQTPPSQV